MRYWERARKAGLPVGDDFGAFWRDFEWMGVQRQLKVLGIFARLYHRDGKAGYLGDMPRVMAYLRGACLRYRALGPLLLLLDELEGRPHTAGTRSSARFRRRAGPMTIGAMILAAGRGERMRPLSDTCPKPLLEAGGKPLIVWQIEALARAGLRRIVINAAHLAGDLVARLGDGRALGVSLAWSIEPEALETAGGIATALPLLPPGPALIVSADVWSAFDYATLLPRAAAMARDSAAPRVHLVMVPNPAYHPAGDFALVAGRTGSALASRSAATPASPTPTSASTTRHCSANFPAGRSSNCCRFFSTGSGGGLRAASATTARGPTWALPPISPRLDAVLRARGPRIT